ncbi:hypothetical protein PIB30_028928 [Stylosanthes scabra]|uniref:Transposase (putative) gypsy type domain-containing protein n=1 Tax=Stylosanthes scabra TaxID=79078 RepID=A0ABU6RBL8_9FABA|nr:hypothetical protein [Stylosanthes scabra]
MVPIQKVEGLCERWGFGPSEQLPRTHEDRRFRRSELCELSSLPEGRFVVMPSHESFFRKLLKMRRQLDLMADIIYWENVEREGVSGPLGKGGNSFLLSFGFHSSLSPLFVTLLTLRLPQQASSLPLSRSPFCSKVRVLPFVSVLPGNHFRPRFFENCVFGFGDRGFSAVFLHSFITFLKLFLYFFFSIGVFWREGGLIVVILPFENRWVANDVLGTPSALDQEYLDELKLTGVLFGGGDLERRYRVEAARCGERVCFMNLDHPTFPHWLWVNEVMFTEFGVRVPFSDFQQRLLNRASVAPSQLHPNSWSSIRCFELVTEFLELPQDPEVFLYLFKLYSSNTSGKTKKGYMSVRPGKYRKIFALYEDSFHDFKGRYFKIFPVGNHRPF